MRMRASHMQVVTCVAPGGHAGAGLLNPHWETCVVPLGHGAVLHWQDPPRLLVAGAWQQDVSVHDDVVVDPSSCPHMHEQSIMLSRLGNVQT